MTEALAAAEGRPVLVTADAGTTVHVSTCWIARRAGIGGIIDFENSNALALEVATSSLRPCKKCKPISRLTWWERSHRRPS